MAKPIIKTCQQCGQPYQTSKFLSTTMRAKSKFCSRICSSESFKIPSEIRFWKYVVKTETCWIWTGALSEAGYGQFSHLGKQCVASRVSFELAFPDKKEDLQTSDVLHKCDNPNCVNPEHLFLGTHLDNMRDKVKKGRQHRGIELWNAKLNDEKVKEILNISQTISNKAKLARMFNVSPKTIANILERKIWTHVSKV